MDEKIKRSSGIEVDLIELPDIPELKADEFSDSWMDELDDGVIRLSDILDDLDKKMKSGKFLHTFTAQIEEVNRMMKMKYASTRDIASVILKDVALSSRIISIVNSPYYGQFSRKGISSIAEAMVILGTEEVQQVASALMLFELMQDIAKSEMLKEKSLTSLMRGMMANEMAKSAKYKARDEFQITAMLYDIGEQIILFCDPDAYQRIRRLSEVKGVDLETASKKLLGASFGRIGQGIVSKWGFPSSVVDAVQPFKEFGIDPKFLTPDKLTRVVASFTNEMCNIGWHLNENQRQSSMEGILRRYGHFLDLGMSAAEDLFHSSMEKIENHARVLKINLKNSRFDRRSGAVPQGGVDPRTDLDHHGGINSQRGLAPQAGAGEALDSGSLAAVHTTSGNRSMPVETDNMEWIRQQTCKIEQLIEKQFKLSDVLHTIITTIYRGFFFSKISICIMNRKKGVMAARFVLGDDFERFSRRFEFSVSEESNDVFNKALHTGVDIIVEDIHNRKAVSRIPDWYLEGNFAASFSLYPLVIKQKKVGLLYVDWDRSRTHLFSNEVKQLMHQLKMMTVTAIKKSKT